MPLSEHLLLVNELQRLIQQQRLKKQISYADLAKELGISKIMLMRYIKEEGIDIPIFKLLNILKALEVSTESIIKAIKIYF
jgi:transcriptional regulator with XRE-family HTH domain